MTMSAGEMLATLNATFNASAAVLLALGYRAIKSGRPEVHKRRMLAAFFVSCAFLASYLTRYALFGDTKFRGQGLWRPFYFSLLISHVLLATVVVPLVLRTLYLAWKGRLPAHKRWAKLTFPVWMYVSVTGVIVYAMLYRVAW
ncbi:MAG: DUF420 domain-containing protein [Polyangiales bacterium]